MHKLNLFLFSLICITLVACDNYSKTENGLRYKFLMRSEHQDLPNQGEYLQCYYSITNSDDSVIYSIFGTNPDRILLTKPTHKGGDIMEALSIMTVGDSARFLISADSFFLKTRGEVSLPSYVKSGSDLKFTIKMDRRLNKFQVDSLINVEKLNNELAAYQPTQLCEEAIAQLWGAAQKTPAIERELLITSKQAV